LREPDVVVGIPIKTLIVDNSALVRTILSRVLSEQRDIAVVARASDAYEARERIIEHRPDVIILDVEMPRIDGLTFLKKLRIHYPVPVIMCVRATAAGSDRALEALESGAIDVVTKPQAGDAAALRRLGEDLADRIRAAANAMPARPPVPRSVTGNPIAFRAAGLDPSRYLVAVGASTGGTEAIKVQLSRAPGDFPPVAIVQHMPEGFTRSFAEHLNRQSALSVTEAADGEMLEPGKAVVARGGVQMHVARAGRKWRARYGTTEPVNRHCPSVDVLFDSVARCAGEQGVGVLLTGMGADGAKGLLQMRRAGAVTIAQDHVGCVVYGMPKVAVELGAAQHAAAPGDVPSVVQRLLRRRDGAGTAKAT